MKTQSDLHLLQRALAYLRPYRHYQIGVYLTMLFITAINIWVPQLIRQGIDGSVFGDNAQLLGQVTLLLLGITLVKGVFTYFQGKWIETSSQNVAYDLRNQLLQKLTDLSFSFHDKTEAGQILTRAMQDVERIRFLTGRAIFRLVEGSTLIIATAVALLSMNATLALLILLTLPVLFYRAYHYGRHIRLLSLDIQNQLGILTTQLEQNLRGARTVKAFAQEEAEIDRFRQQNETWYNLAAQSTRIEAINAPMLNLIANLGTVIIFWYGGWLVIHNQLSLGQLVAFTTYLAMLLRPIQIMGRIIPILAIAASASERIFSILDATADITDSPDARPLPRLQGHVQFQNVSFAYPNSPNILENITLSAQPGQIIALMGATGSGKSSLINLISRFYDPTEGAIYLDGHDIRHVTLHSLRSQIGFVMQDNLLFAAPIRQNITFGRPDASEAEMIQAAKDAQAHDFISAMPDGYDTYVGERGVTLSGGQKQRLAIARALLTDPRILILDDATASVDNKTEQLIQQALNRLMANRTTFVIAHRLSTVQRADLILLLDHGRILAQGTHQQLLASSPLYQQIYHLQLRPSQDTSPTEAQ